MANTTTFQVGTYTALTDTFTPVVNLNDRANWFLGAPPKGLKLDQPQKAYARSFTLRTPGETIAKMQYKNRKVQVTAWLGRALTTAQIITQVRALLAAIEQPPYCIAIQLPGGTNTVYADVVACEHNIPADPQVILAGALKDVTISFECKPFLRGPRQTLVNLVPNPGMEYPSGPGVTVFNDSFTNANAYSTISGSFSIGSNLLQMNAGCQVAFGSPDWSAINLWTARWRWVTGLTASFFLHYTNGSNYLACQITGTSITLVHNVAGTQHTLASGTIALTSSLYYWVQITQFPTVPGQTPQVQCALYADSSGAIGAAVSGSSLGPVVTFDAVTALTGRPNIAATGAVLNVGGAFSSVHYVNLFGPGSWSFSGNYASATGQSSGAWDQSIANTYSGGPVTSYGSARYDLPPAGTVAASWNLYTAGQTFVGSPAVVLGASFRTIGVSAAVSSTGLSGTASTFININEFDGNGNFLRGGTVAGTTKSGNVGAWTTVAGTYTTGASCYAVDVSLRTSDSTANSANGTVWWDNIQVWDQTTTGQTTMPYCETRFAQTPAQVLLTGITGDVAAPCQVACGIYIGTWGPDGVALPYAVGRRGRADANVQLVGNDTGVARTNVLDNGSYGGFYVKKSNVTATAASNGSGLSPRAGDQPGTYHLLARFKSADASPTLVSARPLVQQQLQSWGQSSGLGILNDWYGTYVYPIATASLWTDCDIGQVRIPTQPLGNMQDPTQTYVLPNIQFIGSGSTAYEGDSNWIALLPIDGALSVGTVTNPSNSGQTITTSWVYLYVDGLQAQTGPSLAQPGQPMPTAATTYSIETAPLPNPAHAGGGTGTTTSGFVNANAAADPYLTIDPTIGTTAGSENAAATGVNQFLVRISDFNGTPVQVATQFVYSPLYLWPN